MYYGWTIYRCDPEMLNTGMAMHQLSKVLKNAIRALETADRSYVVMFGNIQFEGIYPRLPKRLLA